MVDKVRHIYKVGQIIRSEHLRSVNERSHINYLLILGLCAKRDVYNVWNIKMGYRAESYDLSPISSFHEEVIYDPG